MELAQLQNLDPGSKVAFTVYEAAHGGKEGQWACLVTGGDEAGNALAVFNELLKAISRKAVKGLHQLKPVIGPLEAQSFDDEFNPKLLAKVKHVDPYRDVCETTPRQHEHALTTREAVRVIVD